MGRLQLDAVTERADVMAEVQRPGRPVARGLGHPLGCRAGVARPTPFGPSLAARNAMLLTDSRYSVTSEILKAALFFLDGRALLGLAALVAMMLAAAEVRRAMGR